MPTVLPWAIPALLGAVGLVQSAKQQHSNNNLANKAIEAQQPQVDAQKELLGLAKGYNPQVEDAAALSGANQNASQQLKRSLGSLSGQFQQAGGSPTGDTAFNIGVQNTANRVMDPLRMFQAQLASTETSRKIDAFRPVLGAQAGGISNAYFNAASMNQPNYGPSLQMFSDALKKMNFATGSAGGGVSGGGFFDNVGMPGDTQGPGGVFYPSGG